MIVFDLLERIVFSDVFSFSKHEIWVPWFQYEKFKNLLLLVFLFRKDNIFIHAVSKSVRTMYDCLLEMDKLSW